MLPKFVATEDIRQVNLDHRQTDGLQRIEDGNGRVRIAARVNDDALRAAPGLLYPVSTVGIRC